MFLLTGEYEMNMNLNEYITQHVGTVATEKHHVNIEEVNFDNFNHSGDVIDFCIGENLYVAKCNIRENSDDFQKWIEIDILECQIIVALDHDDHHIAAEFKFPGTIQASIEEQLVSHLRESNQKNSDWL